MPVSRVLIVASCAVVATLAFGAGSASAFRYYQTQVTEIPGTAPQPGSFGRALKVTTDSANNVWLLDANGFGPEGKDVVDKFDSAGTFLTQATGVGGWFGTESILRDLTFNNSSGLLYVADNAHGELWKLNTNGVVQGSLAPPPSMWSPETGSCCAIRLDADNSGGPSNGDLYVSAAINGCCRNTDQGLYRINPSGDPVNFTAPVGYVHGNVIEGTKVSDLSESGRFESAQGSAAAPNGDIWVTTGAAIDRFDQTGEFISSIDEGPGVEGFGSDIAIDPTNGHLLVAQKEPPTVWEFAGDGSLIEALTVPGGFTGPTGVAVDSSGGLYVADETSIKFFGKDFPIPKITYGVATEPKQTSGTLHATIDPNGGGAVTSCQVEYGTDTSYGSTLPCLPDPSSSPPGSNFTGVTEVSAPLTGLTPEQVYHYRIVAGNENASKYGADQTFTPHWVEGLDTTAPTNLAPDSARLTATFIGNGQPTTFSFKWGKDESYGSSTPEQNAGSPSAEATVHFDLAGLAPVTTYHYRVVATNADGTGEGDDESFTTPPLPPAVIEWVSDVHSDSVLFHAKINPGGGATSYGVEYVDDAHFNESGFTAPNTTAGGDLEAGMSVEEVQETVAGLTPDTTYHYRVFATNPYKTTIGEERVFTTFKSGGVLKDICANAQVRQQTGAALLLDCRAYELVSAGDTGGYDVESSIVSGQAPFAGYPRASDPSRVLYAMHRGALPGPWNPTNLGPDPYVATRSADGWQTQYVGLPGDGLPSAHPFSSALGGADATLGTFAFAGQDLCAPCFADGKAGVPIHLPDGSIVQGMAGSLDPGAAANADILVRKRLSEDGSHFVFGSTSKFEPDASSGDPSIYDRDLTTATTHVVSKLPDGTNIPCLMNCASNGIAELDISEDGSRILIGQLVSIDPEGNHYWHLYANVGDSPQGIDLMLGSTSGGLYDGMSSNGDEVYFTTRDKLSEDTDSSADIYRADVGSSSVSLTRVSAGSGGTGDTDACNPAFNDSRPRWNSIGEAANCDSVAIGGGGGVAADGGAIFLLSPELLDGAGNGTQDAPNLYLAQVGSKPHYVTTLESSLVVPQPPPSSHPFLREFEALSKPTGVAFDSAGDFVYVLEPGEFAGKVAKFDSKGHPVNFTAGSEEGGNVLTGADTDSGFFAEYAEFGLPIQLAVDESNGDFYVPNLLGQGFVGAVDKFAADGEFLYEIPMSSFFSLPAAVAVNQQNHDLYLGVAGQSKVQVFDSAGNPKFEFESIAGPTSMAVDSNGRIYVSNGSEAALYKPTGELERMLPLASPRGVAVDASDDHVYVDEGARITEFDPAGNPVGDPIGGGHLANSKALAVSAGTIVATDTDKGIVAIWGPTRLSANPEYDNALVIDAVGEAETRRTADFQVSPTGAFAAFPSRLPLTGYDNDGHLEIYRYAAGGSIDCASCAPTGSRTTGESSLAARGLSLSDDGRVFFSSREPLVPSDLNGSEDAFEWKNGEIGPISSGSSPIDSSLLSISADGTDAYFFTRETLAPQDESGNSVKIYDARAGGGFPFDPNRQPCKASDECHGPGSTPAPPPNIGTYEGTRGNFVAPSPKKKKKKHHHRHKRRHHRTHRGGRHG